MLPIVLYTLIIFWYCLLIPFCCFQVPRNYVRKVGNHKYADYSNETLQKVLMTFDQEGALKLVPLNCTKSQEVQ